MWIWRVLWSVSTNVWYPIKERYLRSTALCWKVYLLFLLASAELTHQLFLSFRSLTKWAVLFVWAIVDLPRLIVLSSLCNSYQKPNLTYSWSISSSLQKLTTECNSSSNFCSSEMSLSWFRICSSVSGGCENFLLGRDAEEDIDRLIWNFIKWASDKHQETFSFLRIQSVVRSQTREICHQKVTHMEKLLPVTNTVFNSVSTQK